MKLKQGDWIDGFDGIGQICSIDEITVDELHVINEPSLELGEHLMDVVEYKILCDFDGKIRKRNRFKSCNLACCNTISEASSNILRALKKSNKEDFARYEKAKRTQSPGDWAYLYLRQEASVEPLYSKLSTLCGELGEPMTFCTFREMLKGLCENLDFYRLDQSMEKPYITLSFFHENYKYEGAKRLFSRVNCTRVAEYA